MGTYITHEGLPFHGALEKIRIRSCRVADLSLPGFDEKQLLEITRDGTAKLTQKTPEGTKKAKTRISQADTDYIFAAFSEICRHYDDDEGWQQSHLHRLSWCQQHHGGV